VQEREYQDVNHRHVQSNENRDWLLSTENEDSVQSNSKTAGKVESFLLCRNIGLVACYHSKKTSFPVKDGVGACFGNGKMKVNINTVTDSMRVNHSVHRHERVDSTIQPSGMGARVGPGQVSSVRGKYE
jgi:CTP synthase (UTP-ammonia lyase)